MGIEEDAIKGKTLKPDVHTNIDDGLRVSTEQARNDPRSTEPLIEFALTEEDEDKIWEAISLLHFRGNREVFEAARKLCESNNANERRLGADILGQLGLPDRAFPDEAVAILLGLLEDEEEATVLNSVAVALGHMRSPLAVDPLSSLKNHPHEDVRDGVVFGLLTHKDMLAIETLIELSADEVEHVRDWATFGLGSMIETDTKEVRDALARRLNDEHDDTRFEALVGLARRNDEQVIGPLLEELSSDDVSLEALDIAAYGESPMICPALLALKARWEGRDDEYTKLLEHAISMCECDDVDTNEAENSATEK